ncbi:MAG: LysM peptidoglycan-binding domain-containing protein [Chthoniobacterales bacterium]
MKMPKLFRPKKKLRATTARRSLSQPDEMDYEEMSEPNMKLSRALLIVLVLHVVAVAGIIAFNTIKSRQGAFPPASARPVATETEQTAAPKETAAPMSAKAEEAKPALPVSKDDHASEPAKAALPVSGLSESGKTYTVVKGDNPVKIARKFKVSQSDLLKINQIDDPRKLQIGQKLIIPASTKKSKK